MKRIGLPLLVCILFSARPLSALEYADFDRFQGCLSRQTIEEKLRGFLVKDREVENYFLLTNETFSLFSSPEKKEGEEAEYCLQLAPQTFILDKSRPCSLKGAKIAIDPGHFGGEYARLEQRFIQFTYYDEERQPHQIQFDEGTLAFLIALQLKKRLEQQGSEVLLTREGIGKGALEEDFFTWLRKHPASIGQKRSLSQIFRSEYNLIDLRARAAKINAFSPDVTVVIHLNAHGSGKGEAVTSPKNYDIVFLPGSFSKGELRDQDSRIEFLRLIVTQDLEESERLCNRVLQAFTCHLEVPPVSDDDNISYLNSVCLKRNEGIYARNLCLTRLVHGPICYGESLIQNHLPEAIALSRRDACIEGIPCSSRLIMIGDAYYEAIVNYFEQKSPCE